MNLMVFSQLVHDLLRGRGVVLRPVCDDNLQNPVLNGAATRSSSVTSPLTVSVTYITFTCMYIDLHFTPPEAYDFP